MDVTIKCPCPPNADGTPRHQSDTVTLKDKLNFREGTTITKAAGLTGKESDTELERSAEVLAVLSEFYILIGVASWTLRGTKPIEVSKAAIRQYILEDPEIAAVITEAADDLYNEVVLLPLVRRASNSSQPSPTTSPTSAKPHGEQQKRPRPSKRSSTSSTRTAATETTSSSLAIVSSSSLSEGTAA